MRKQDKTGNEFKNNMMTRRTALTLAAAVATFGAAMGMRATAAWAQGKMEGDSDERRNYDRDRDVERDRDYDRDRRGERKGEGKEEGKGEGKEGRQKGKRGHIKVDINGDNAASIDVTCAEGESMKTCADLTKEIIDKVKSISPK
jgi:Ni/Co efflux regulator RcnB